MKSNYKRLGNYIREVDIRNIGLHDIKLLGVSIQKVFMDSIANTIGTDMSTYKMIKRGQFAYGPVTSRNGDKISVALLDEFDQAIISQAYTSFEITNTNELLPEYLMMWFRRPEFDRYARFMSHGSAREIFSWEDMCDVELPVPSIDKQMEIVKEYHIIVDRIEMNNKLIEKLEETAQMVYKQWFVDFEFPDENGQPYRTNGGEMKFVLDGQIEIPASWRSMKIGDLCECNPSTISSKDKIKSITYLDTGSITNNEIEAIQTLNLEEDEIPSRAKRKVNHNDIVFSTVRPNLKHFGILKNIAENMVVSTGFAVLRTNHSNLCSELIYLSITNEEVLSNLQSRAEMSVSTYPSINPEDLLDINFFLPPEEFLKKTQTVFESIFIMLANYQKEKSVLKKLHDVLLAKLASIGGGVL